MKLSCLQFKPELEKKEFNIAQIQNFIDNVDSDILIFPELSTTGYFFTDKSILHELADESSSAFIEDIQNAAINKNRTIILGFAEKNNDKIYNSAAVLMPNPAQSFVYRKTHLFYKESFVFDPGDTGFKTVYDKERDFNIGAMICYDWRFPEAARTLALQGADVIAVPSNLVTDVWHLVMPARALENKVFLAVANRIGAEYRGDEELFFKGESAVYSYNGGILAKASLDMEEVITVEIEPQKTRNKSFNPINDIFKDRRPEMYKL